MYKLIIGNVRISVMDDEISRSQAIQEARQAISTANNQNKVLSHIEITNSVDGLEVSTTEKTGAKLLRKSLKQSMLDGMLQAIQEKFTPNENFSTKDAWFDNDTGQEWHGNEVVQLRKDLISQLEEWSKTI